MPSVSLDRTTKARLSRLAKAHRSAADAAERARLELREALIAAREQATVRELAEATDLTFQRVQQIVGPGQRRSARS